MRFCQRWVALLAFVFLSRAAAAQEAPLGPFKLQPAHDVATSQSLERFSPIAQETNQGTSSRQQKPPESVHNGSSNELILWTLPNFLTVEDAASIPPLTPGQKFKVVARGVFDPFEFVLVGFVAGLGQASNSNPSYGQGIERYAKR